MIAVSRQSCAWFYKMHFEIVNDCTLSGSLQRFKPLKDRGNQATFSSRSSTNTDSLGVSRFLEPAGEKIGLVRMVWLQILWTRSNTHDDIRLKTSRMFQFHTESHCRSFRAKGETMQNAALRPIIRSRSARSYKELLRVRDPVVCSRIGAFADACLACLFRNKFVFRCFVQHRIYFSTIDEYENHIESQDMYHESSEPLLLIAGQRQHFELWPHINQPVWSTTSTHGTVLQCVWWCYGVPTHSML